MRRWLKRIAIVLAVFVLPPVGYFFCSAWLHERELQGVLSELDANETPWRWHDLLAARPKVREEEDARAVVLKACQLAAGFSRKYQICDKAVERPPYCAILPEDFEPFDELMKTVQPALTAAQQLRRMPAPKSRVDWSEDVLAGIDNDTAKTRTFVNMLDFAAAWHAQHGDLDAAMDDCMVMQRSCQSFEDEPTLLVHLVRMSLQSMSLWGLERVLAQGQPTPERLEQLQRAWAQFDQHRAMVTSLRGERAYCQRVFEALANRKISVNDLTGDQGGVSKKNAALPIWDRVTDLYLQGNLKQSQTWSLRHWAEVIKTMDLPEPERAARQRELDDERATAPGVARIVVSASRKVLEAHRRAEALTRCAVVALAAERFRREHDRWPKSLAELCPKFLAKVPDDPYFGKPLQLRNTADGIVIYSVGRDGKQCGNYQEVLEAKTTVIFKYEFRLWNVSHRRKIVARQP